jgi:redox-sensitive bicupin YhaK (pirin superfamily)
MEIVTYVCAGAITHRDNMGDEGHTETGDAQTMSAGTGVVHAEYNREQRTTTISQIWILPDRRSAKPNWGSKTFPKAADESAFEVLASDRPADVESDALPLNADAAVLATTLKAGQTLRQSLAVGRAVYLVPASGTVAVNGVPVNARDGAVIRDEAEIVVTAREEVELVVVEAAAA